MTRLAHVTEEQKRRVAELEEVAEYWRYLLTPPAVAPDDADRDNLIELVGDLLRAFGLEFAVPGAEA